MNFGTIASTSKELANDISLNLKNEKGNIEGKWEGSIYNSFNHSFSVSLVKISNIITLVSTIAGVSGDIASLEKVIEDLKVKEDQLALDPTDQKLIDAVIELKQKKDDLVIKINKALLTAVEDTAPNKPMIYNNKKNELDLIKDPFRHNDKKYLNIPPAKKEVDLTKMTTRTKDPSYGEKYYGSDNPYSGRNPSLDGQCTAYATGRSNEIADQVGGKKMTVMYGHANKIFANAQAQGFNTTNASEINNLTDLSPGDTLCWTNIMYKGENCGHVAVVEKVENGKVTITHDNVPNWETRTFNSIEEIKRLYGGTLQGVVHQTPEEL